MMLKIKSAKYVHIGPDGNPAASGAPSLLLNFTDGRQARVLYEQRLFFRGVRAVVLSGGDFSDLPPVLSPPDLADDRRAIRVENATTDIAAVQMFEEFKAAVDGGTFIAGSVAVPDLTTR